MCPGGLYSDGCRWGETVPELWAHVRCRPARHVITLHATVTRAPPHRLNLIACNETFVGRLPALTGVRGIAALLVLLYHAFLRLVWSGPEEPGVLAHLLVGYGWLGVDLFFVLSAFLLARPFLNGKVKINVASWGQFLKRRWMRTAPPYYAAILFAAAVAGTMSKFWTNPQATLLHLFYLANVSVGTLEQFNLVVWSLQVEFQFYILLPLFLWLLTRRSAAWSLAGLLVASAAWQYFMFKADAGLHNVHILFQIPGYLFHFGVGIAAARLEVAGWKSPIRAAILAPAAFLVLVVGAVLVTDPPADAYSLVSEHVGFVLLRILPAAGFGILIFLMATNDGWANNLFSNRAFAGLGQISYSLYLVHLPVITFIATVFPATMGFGLPIFTLICAVPSLVLSAAFYVLIERPSLNWKDGRVKLKVPSVPRALRDKTPPATPDGQQL